MSNVLGEHAAAHFAQQSRASIKYCTSNMPAHKSCSRRFCFSRTREQCAKHASSQDLPRSRGTLGLWLPPGDSNIPAHPAWEARLKDIQAPWWRASQTAVWAATLTAAACTLTLSQLPKCMCTMLPKAVWSTRIACPKSLCWVKRGQSNYQSAVQLWRKKKIQHIGMPIIQLWHNMEVRLSHHATRILIFLLLFLILHSSTVMKVQMSSIKLTVTHGSWWFCAWKTWTKFNA